MQSSDVTARVRDAVRTLRDRRQQKLDAEQRLKDLNEDIERIEHSQLPDLFREADVMVLGLPAEGNVPGYNATLQPYYRANIAADWPQEQRAKAFEALDALGAGDLIKNTIVIQLGRGENDMARRIAAGLDKLKVSYTIGLAVSWQTLTAWLREQAEAGNPLPEPLSLIGATVGTIVKLKEVKPK